MPKPRHESDRPRNDKRWRCHKCGAKTTLRTIRVERDEDFNRLRIRRCTNCQEVMATEETVITLDQFYARCTVRKEQAAAQWVALKNSRRQAALKDCPHCGLKYHIGKFSKHVQTPEHEATLKHKATPAKRARARRGGIKKYWKQRGIDINTANSNTALADLTGVEPSGDRNDRIVARLEDLREDKDTPWTQQPRSIKANKSSDASALSAGSTQ